MKNPWRGAAFFLAVVLVLMTGIAVAMVLAPGTPPASSSPSPTAPGAEPTPSSSELPPTPTAGSSDKPSASVAPSSPDPSASGTGPATATIRGLKVDGSDDPDGRDRQITFRTDEPATVSMRIVASPLVPIDACLAVNAVELYCTSGRSFTMTGETSRSSATWTLTLRGQGANAPALDVTVTFPAAEPAITIAGAWFDGAARPDYNGVVFELAPRDPLVSISATWEGSYPYRLTIRELLGTGVLDFDGTAAGVTQDVLVGEELQRIELLNTGPGATRIPFTATIAW